MILPPNKIWQQNRSDILGSLAASFNLNLTEELGKTKVTPRTIITTNGITNLGTAVSFREYSTDLFAMAPAATSSNAGLFQSTGGLLKTVFALSTITGADATTFSCDYSDMEVFFGKLVLAGDSTKYLYGNTGSFTASAAVLTANVNHKLLNSVTNTKLYIFSTTTKIQSINTDFTDNTSGSYTLDLASAIPNSLGLFLISMFESDDGYIWILTGNTMFKDSFIYLWDGVTVNFARKSYPIYSRAALAGIVKDGTPYIIDADGQLQYFNGGSFIHAPNGKLPIKNQAYLTNPMSLKNDRWLHPNGISLDNGRINILVNNLNHDNGGTINEYLPSGVWEYDPDIGWYHKEPLTQYDYSGAAAITDYGQNRLSRVGALYNFKKDDTSATTVGTMLAGADYYTSATVTKSAIWTNDSLDLLQKYGYLVTSKIFSPNIQDVFGKIYMRFRGLLTSTDRVWIKYRIDDVPPVELTVTWTSGTTFTVSTTSIANYDTDDEVEGISGQGGGRCSQIVSKVDAAGTSTVTLSETLGASSGTAKIRFQHWKLASVLTEQGKTVQEFNIDKTVPWIQLKVCMLFTGNNEIYDFVLPNNKMQ